MPPPSKVGRPREVDMREVWNAIQYIASGGIAWALLPKDFPPSSTVRYWFYRFRNEGSVRKFVQEANAGMLCLKEQRMPEMTKTISSNSLFLLSYLIDRDSSRRIRHYSHSIVPGGFDVMS